jgi:hypothetical protein
MQQTGNSSEPAATPPPVGNARGPRADAAASRAESPAARALSAWLSRYAVWIALGLITLYALAQALWLMPARVSNPYANSMVEAQPVAGALRVARGEPLYRDYRAGEPVVPLTYGALQYAVPGWVARATGEADARELAQLGRATSLAAGIGIALFAALLARRQGARSVWPWFAAAPLLWFPYPLEWFAKFAPDAPALMLSLAGWCIAGSPSDSAAQTPQGPTSGWRSAGALARGAGAVLCWTLAFHFKPTIVVGPIGFAVEALVLARPPLAGRPGSAPFGLGRWFGQSLGSPQVVAAATLGLVFAACCLVSGLAIDRATSGLWRLNLVDAMRVCAYDASFVAADLRMLRFDGLMTLVWMAVVAVALFRASAAGLTFLVVLPIDLTLMSKQGSSANYLLESIAVWGIAASAAFGSGTSFGPSSRPALDRTTASWLLFPVFALLLVGAGKMGTVFWEITPPAANELREVDALIANTPPSAVLGLDAFHALSRGLALPFADPYHASLLARHGVVDFDTIAQALRRGTYPVVVGNRLLLGNASYHGQALYPEVLHSALRDGYRVAYEGRWFVAWVPRESPRAAR